MTVTADSEPPWKAAAALPPVFARSDSIASTSSSEPDADSASTASSSVSSCFESTRPTTRGRSDDEREDTQRGPEERPCQLLSSFEADDLLQAHANRFARPPLAPGINLRNFRVQATRYASVSDIVIYAARGPTREAVALARRFADAQDAMRSQRAVRYHVYVVTDSFDVFERCHPDLVAVDRRGWPRRKVDFMDREREEMRALTAASEIGDNVYLGNTSDVPVATPTSAVRERVLTSDSASSFGTQVDQDAANPVGFSVCIEAHDQAQMSRHDYLRALEHQLKRHALAVTSDGRRRDIVRPDATADILHLECLSTTQAVPSVSGQTAFLDQIVHLAVWVTCQSRPRTKSAIPPRRVLLHCQDGYTDTAILALAYIMYSRALTLPEAYLFLQNQCDRSFFVYPADRDFLNQLEHRIGNLVASERRAGRSAPAVPRPLPLAPAAKIASAPWFYDERFDGHFPSRILDTLYLGNINHACTSRVPGESA